MTSYTVQNVHVHNYRPIVSRLVGLIIIGCVIAIFIFVAVPARVVMLTGLSQADLQSLENLNLSPLLVATGVIAFRSITFLAFLAPGILIFWRKPTDKAAVFFSMMLIFVGASFPPPLSWPIQPYSTQYFLINSVETIALILFKLAFYLFPDGRFIPRWTRVLAVIWVGWNVTKVFFPQSLLEAKTWPPVLWFLWGLIWGISDITAQIHRYFYVSRPPEKQQTKWVILGLLVFFPAAVFYYSFYMLYPSLLGLGISFSLYELITSPILALSLSFLSLSTSLSILRYRLWSIDILINRTLVYVLLSATITGIYIVLVVGLGIVFQSSYNVYISLGTTVIVAAFFQPLRDWLQRNINRLMYGNRDDPYVVLSQLGQRLETALSHDAVLPMIAETIAKTLKLPYVAIEAIVLDGQVAPVTFVSPGFGHSSLTYPDDLFRIPLTYQSEPLGNLTLALRAPNETFTPKEQRLLADIARQIGVALHAKQLMMDLQRSREQLVTTREEERRRLRRDLHDGLGPQLASQTLTLSAARKLLYADPQAADALLGEAAKHAQAAISDIRRLVYDLRPPALDDLGLVAALGSLTQQYFQSGISFTVTAPALLPPLPAAVEVACYRIAQEALTNVVKHSQARNCSVSLIVNGGLSFEASDDGVGLLANRPSGIGLASMRERVEELGGSFTLDSKPGHGTKITAWLPISNAA